MDRNFLSEISKGYLVDHNVYNEFNKNDIEKIYNKVHSMLVETTDMLYELDPDTYNDLYEMGKLNQQRVFEYFLNLNFEKDSDKLIAENLLDKLEDEIINESDAATSSILSTIFQAFRGAFGDPLLVVIFTILILYLWFAKRITITKALTQAVAAIGKVMEITGNFLIKNGRYAQINYAVLHKNSERCYRKCGIKDFKQFRVTDYFNRHAIDKAEDFFAPKNAKCLAHCLIETEVQKIKLMTKLYFVCLRQTNTFDNISNMTTEQFMQIMLTDKDSQTHRQHNVSMATACAEYFDMISMSMKNLNDFVEYFIADKTTQREIIMLIQKDIDFIKRDVIKMDQRQLEQFRAR